MLLFALIECKESKTKQTEVIETPAKEEMINPVYIGTYTKNEGFVDGKANGIYLMNKKSDGALEMVKTVAEITNPSYVKISKDGNNLYAVSELGEGDSDSGFIYAFKINDDYSLTELGKLSTEGSRSKRWNRTLPVSVHGNCERYEYWSYRMSRG